MYQCAYCGLESSSPAEFNRHLKTEHLKVHQDDDTLYAIAGLLIMLASAVGTLFIVYKVGAWVLGRIF